ncbi:MAG: carboxynorspermidine decarboxylase [Sorangiineae bacterium NIC37A_2]|nr:MAG: carboxynorspermidine decarboxylase [Sorangiineae bacterium NIC37A_2]
MTSRKAALREGVRFDPYALPSPYYIVDLGLLRKNLEILRHVQDQTGAKILLALKGFAMWSVFPITKRYLVGVTSSSVHEARLGREEWGGEVHAYAPAYTEADIEELIELADHVVFNSPRQWQRYGDRLQAQGIECGLRLNPEHREVEVALYDPCAPGSRLGTRRAELEGIDTSGLDGLHFHTLCQKNSDALERTVKAFEERFGDLIPGKKWVNFGGGHHITRADYEVDRLIRIVREFQQKWGVQVYLEPGEAIALGTGYLVAEVLDIVGFDQRTVILDTSATAHMPDVLEMPYRPGILGAGMPEERPYTYRLGGLTCLAGDVIGDYSFDEPLEIGDRLVFTDMAHYTMVKTTTFNGVRHPSIATFDPETGESVEVRRFGYDDYKRRLS